MSEIEDMRLYICVRNDLKMTKGKIAGQCCHGAVDACMNMFNRDRQLYEKYNNSDHVKIILKVDNEEELFRLQGAARAKNIYSVIIEDKGYTQIPSGTKTAIALGPASEFLLKSITGHLRLL